MNSGQKLRIGTRASALARWQAEWVAGQLAKLGADVELVFLATEGDVKAGPIGQIGGQGLFTKRIQQALLDGEVDAAVHSLKDLPTESFDGLTIAAVPPRESPHDVLVCRESSSLDELPGGARVGTGSLRRRAQLLHARNDLDVQDIRGNVDTRLRKLDDGEYDAIVLAEAGLKRLGLDQRVTQVLSPPLMLPAIGQGALGIETRSDDSPTIATVAALDHLESRAAVFAERTMLATLRGGCLAPVGAWGRIELGQLHLDGVVLSHDGAQRITASATGPLTDLATIGNLVAETLLSQGAAELIAASRTR